MVWQKPLLRRNPHTQRVGGDSGTLCWPALHVSELTAYMRLIRSRHWYEADNYSMHRHRGQIALVYKRFCIGKSFGRIWTGLYINGPKFQPIEIILGIIEKIHRLEVSLCISETIGKGPWFFIRFSSFLLYRNCKRLREFDEIEISRRRCRGDCE